MWKNHALYKPAEVCDVTVLTLFYGPGRTRQDWVYQ